MRELQNSIRTVNIKGKVYYVYDLKSQYTNKKQRVYGNTEEELIEKVNARIDEQISENVYIKPEKPILREYIELYFKNSLNTMSATKLKRFSQVVEGSIYGSEIDKDMTELTAEELSTFFRGLFDKYPVESVIKSYEIVGEAFKLSNLYGDTDFNFSKVKLPKVNKQPKTYPYILTPDEYDRLLNFCLDDNCHTYGSGELIITLALYTGVKYTELTKTTADNFYEKDGKAYLKIGKADTPLSEECVNWLKRMKEEGKLNLGEDKGIPLFLNSDKNETSVVCISRTFEAIAKKRCGYPNGVGTKTLQKAFVVKSLLEGVPAEELAKNLGLGSKANVKKIADEFEIQKKLF